MKEKIKIEDLVTNSELNYALYYPEEFIRKLKIGFKEYSKVNYLRAISKLDQTQKLNTEELTNYISDYIKNKGLIEKGFIDIFDFDYILNLNIKTGSDHRSELVIIRSSFYKLTYIRIKISGTDDYTGEAISTYEKTNIDGLLE